MALQIEISPVADPVIIVLQPMRAKTSGKCPAGCDIRRDYQDLEKHYLTKKHKLKLNPSAVVKRPPQTSGICPLKCRGDLPYARLQAHKRTKKHRFAEMLAREEARNDAADQPGAAAQSVSESGVGKRKGGLTQCPLGCAGGREYSDLARHKLTNMHLKAEAEANARAQA